MNLNKFQLVGNLTRDSDIRYIPVSDVRGFLDIGVNQAGRDSAGQKQEKK